MNHDNRIRDAIDESLGSVRFSANDTRAVLSAVRAGHAHSRRAKARKKRFDLVLAVMTAALVIVPVALFALRAQKAPITDISAMARTPAAAGESSTAEGSVSPVLDESDAIRAARACFDARCSGSAFTFEEYTVSVSLQESVYTILMQSIYDNGCRFEVAVSSPEGAILSFSDPIAATQPGPLRMDSPEVKAWFDKYGPDRSAWPAQSQAEFARRYEGTPVN